MNETETTPSQDMKQYYILGIVVLVAVVVAGYMLRPKSGETTTPTPVAQQAAAVPTPTPGPITRLACDVQYFNPKIGFPEYYLSVDGGDVTGANTVDCTFTAKVKDSVVATTKVTSPLTAAPQRGGMTFRCTTKAISLQPGVATVVDVALKDDAGATSTCSGAFTFPRP